jgi:hypothetical protein
MKELGMIQTIRILIALELLVALPAFGEDEGNSKSRLQEMKRQAAEYKVTLATKPAAELKLHEEPLLRFDNPVGGVPDGIVVMWKDGQRPAVLAQVFQTAEGVWVHECQSLARAGLNFEKDSDVRWHPIDAADSFRALDAPAAAPSPAKRLVQMKQIAAEFKAADDFKVRASDKETTRHELRLLPTPVYRYSDKAAEVEDGAVFAFVHGTDPELFLVLEQRGGEGKDKGWQYTLVPMTCWAVEAKRGDKVVWNVGERLGKSKPADPYHVWIYRNK